MAFLEDLLNGLFFTSTDALEKTQLQKFMHLLPGIGYRDYKTQVATLINKINKQADPLAAAEAELGSLLKYIQTAWPKTTSLQSVITKTIQAKRKITDKLRRRTAEKHGRAFDENSADATTATPAHPPASSPGTVEIPTKRRRHLATVTPVSELLDSRSEIIDLYFNTEKYEEAATNYLAIYEAAPTKEGLTNNERQKLVIILLNDVYQAHRHHFITLLENQPSLDFESICDFKMKVSMCLTALDTTENKLLESVKATEPTSGVEKDEDARLKDEYNQTIKALECKKSGYSAEESDSYYKKNLWQLAVKLFTAANTNKDVSYLDLISPLNLLNVFSVRHSGSKKTETHIARFKTKMMSFRNKILLEPVTTLEAKADIEVDELSAVIQYQQAVQQFTALELAEIKGETSPLKQGLALANSVFLLWKGDDSKELIRHAVEGSVYYFLALLPKLNALTVEQLEREENKLTADDLLDFLVSMYQYIKNQRVLISTAAPTKAKRERTVAASWTEKWRNEPLAKALGKPPLDYLADLLLKFTSTCKAINISGCGVDGEDVKAAETILRERGLLVVAPGMSP